MNAREYVKRRLCTYCHATKCEKFCRLAEKCSEAYEAGEKNAKAPEMRYQCGKFNTCPKNTEGNCGGCKNEIN